MSKKKIKKPKKRMPIRKSNTYEKFYVQKDKKEDFIDIIDLINHLDDVTDIETLKAVYAAYNSPVSPLYDLSKADAVLERLLNVGDVYVCVGKGIELFEAGKREEAFPYLQKGAICQDSAAQFYCGLYFNFKEEYQKAVFYFEEAAKQGFASACFNAFVLYHTNEVVKDLKKAQYYLNQSLHYHHSRTINLAWQLNLQQPLDHRDDQAALEALEFDINFGNKMKLYELEYTYVVADMTDEKFFALLEKIPKDNINVQRRLAECYLYGIGTKSNPCRALSYYKRFPHDLMAKMLIKYMDVNDPLGSMMKAAKKNKASCYVVGKMFMLGSYGEVDFEKAKMYLEKGMSKKYPFVTNALGHIYLHEDHDYQKARELLEKDQLLLKESEDLMRLRDLYTLYAKGLGVEKNENKALSHTNCLNIHKAFEMLEG